MFFSIVESKSKWLQRFFLYFFFSGANLLTVHVIRQVNCFEINTHFLCIRMMINSIEFACAIDGQCYNMQWHNVNSFDLCFVRIYLIESMEFRLHSNRMLTLFLIRLESSLKLTMKV